MSSDVDDLAREVERWRKAAAVESDRADAAERRLADLASRVSRVMDAMASAIEGVSAAKDTLSPRGDACAAHAHCRREPHFST